MSTPQADSGVRHRTRRAILDAALAVWARDWNASLGDIADQAAVSRSTLHRYFPDRQALVEATKERALEAFEEAGCDATSGSGTAREELDALLRNAVAAGDAVIYLYSDPHRFGDEWAAEDPGSDHTEMRELVVRAQAEGAIAADVDPDWVISVFYSLVYVGAESINAGTLPRHRAGEISSRTFFGGVAPG
ncbi:TetR/AcrR family transcriptional regulator [Nocardioides sp. AE5]|uniref:TetR/AcrR family transcriptional regulator n=1 Tax=Nocardioides sp. AE5 TaxID=2962573 RepID=UPI0028815AEC|nr:TetR/AcrR family transcriptional regulator [Nocardioides sp. AE5]MDT0202410.1 TetR/AcrR family transcriptional regulator [Nocardioides sp. AE5]